MQIIMDVSNFKEVSEFFNFIHKLDNNQQKTVYVFSFNERFKEVCSNQDKRLVNLL